MENDSSHDVRPLVRRLGKPPGEWRRQDLVEMCLDDGIRVINFRYPSFDGKLRELRLPVGDRAYLERILAGGERVDGSSLFPGLFETGASDLYALPVYRWAFLNPWSADELDIVCRFGDRGGGLCPLTPDNVLAAAATRVRERAGVELEALAEVEFYLILEREDDRFTGKAQRNYHQSAPYLHGRDIADEILRAAAAVTGAVKYGHSEVGYIDRLESDSPELDGKRVEQHELELDLMPLEDLGCWLPVVRWLTRVIAHRHGASVTFAPKLDEDMAGSGLHLHLALRREGDNILLDQGGLSSEALCLIGGLLGKAGALAGFGNTVAASYLRLVPDQEAPTKICWGRHNRSGLIRIPLDFGTGERLDQLVNPDEEGSYPLDLARPTVEYRGPDGSAFGHLLLAAVAMAVGDGLTDGEAEARARLLEVDATPGVPEGRLEALPDSAVAAAGVLRRERSFFEGAGMPSVLVDLVLAKLEGEGDQGLRARLGGLPAAERLAESRRVMHKDLHKH